MAVRRYDLGTKNGQVTWEWEGNQQTIQKVETTGTHTTKHQQFYLKPAWTKWVREQIEIGHHVGFDLEWTGGNDHYKKQIRDATLLFRSNNHVTVEFLMTTWTNQFDNMRGRDTRLYIVVTDNS